MKMRKQVLAVTIGVLLILSVFSVLQFWQIKPAQATEIFADGFESNDFTAWSSTYGSPAINSTIVYSGSRSAKFSGTQVFVSQTITAADLLYVKAYFYLSSLPSVDDHIENLMYLYGGSGACCYAQIKRVSTVAYWSLEYIADDTSDNTVVSTFTPVTEAWYCVELFWHNNTANGAALYINTTKVAEAPLTTADRTITTCRLGDAYSDDTVTCFMDDASILDSDVPTGVNLDSPLPSCTNYIFTCTNGSYGVARRSDNVTLYMDTSVSNVFNYTLVNANSNDKIYVNAGTYSGLLQSLPINASGKNGIELWGNSANTSIITLAASQAYPQFMLKMLGTVANPIKDWYVHNLVFNGTDALQTDQGLQVWCQNVQNLTFVHNIVENCSWNTYGTDRGKPFNGDNLTYSNVSYNLVQMHYTDDRYGKNCIVLSSSSHDDTISYNSVIGGGTAITLVDNLWNCTVNDNVCTNQSMGGIVLYGGDLGITFNNTISNNVLQGRSDGYTVPAGSYINNIAYPSTANNNTYNNNTYSNYNLAFQIGDGGHYNNFYNNTITNCAYGVILIGHDNQVFNNSISASTVGIKFEEDGAYNGTANTVTNNTIASSLLGISFNSGVGNFVINNTVTSALIGLKSYYATATNNYVGNNTLSGCTSKDVQISAGTNFVFYYNNFASGLGSPMDDSGTNSTFRFNIALTGYYMLNLTTVGGGITSPTGNGWQYISGTSVSVTWTPNSGNSRQDFAVDNVNKTTTTSPYSIIMSTNHNATAYFSGGEPPIVLTITGPTNTTYSGDGTVTVELSASGGTVDTIWWNCTTTSGTVVYANQTYTTITSMSLGSGSYIFNAGANSTVPNTDTGTVWFTVTLEGGTNLLIVNTWWSMYW